MVDVTGPGVVVDSPPLVGRIDEVVSLFVVVVVGGKVVVVVIGTQFEPVSETVRASGSKPGAQEQLKPVGLPCESGGRSVHTAMVPAQGLDEQFCTQM